MIWMEPGVYVRVEPLQGARAPQPQPLDSGFVKETAYRVLGMHTPSETADAYVVLSNEDDQIWFICTRHLRVVGVLPTATVLRMPLSQWPSAVVRPWATPAPREGSLPAPLRQMAARDDAG